MILNLRKQATAIKHILHDITILHIKFQIAYWLSKKFVVRLCTRKTFYLLLLVKK